MEQGDKESQVKPKPLAGIGQVLFADDEMSARLDLVPLRLDGSRLSLEEVLAALKEAGVVYGIQEEAIVAALELGKAESGLVVALGSSPRPGTDAGISFGFHLGGHNPQAFDAARREGRLLEGESARDLVLAGDILARKIPARPGEEGRTVTGKVRPAPPVADLSLVAGENVSLKDEGQTLVVAEGLVAGYPDYHQQTISVADPLRLSEDRMQAFLDIYPPGIKGVGLSEELVIRLLKRQRISHGIRKNTVIRALARVAERQRPLLGVLVARGTPPILGQDAIIELYGPKDKLAGLISDKTGRINFRERNLIHSVKAGDLLARKTAAEPGQDGHDIQGRILPATAGEDRSLPVHSNVTISEDGLLYTAAIDGMVTLVDREKLAVVPVFEVNGDVDYSTGNLEMAGALVIKGWVRSGFTVRAGGDIVIGGGVEEAHIHADGAISITGGVVGMGQARIRAGGDFSAHFLEQAQVEAGGNIEIRDQIMRSTVFAAGFLSAFSGRGRIRGGTVAAIKGIEANELGSEAGVRTLVMAGVNLPLRRRLAELRRRLQSYRRERAKMDTVLGRALSRGRAAELQKEMARKLSVLAKRRRALVQAEERLAGPLAELARELATIDPVAVKIVVRRETHIGTTILIGEKLLKPVEDLKKPVTFRLDPAGERVIIA